MAHDDHKKGHGHSHDHHHHDNHHDHHPADHHHHWDQEDYVRSWIARDAGRRSERGPLVERLIAAAPFPRDAVIEVLDVGGGAGLLTEAVLKAYPRSQAVLQDFSTPMVEAARRRLTGFGPRVRYVISDLGDPAWSRTASGPFDLAVSGIAIHNLHEMAAIARCYEAVRGLLKPGGAFLDYDHFDRVGGVPLHQHMLKVAGFAAAEVVWHEHPTAILKASV